MPITVVLAPELVLHDDWSSFHSVARKAVDRGTHVILDYSRTRALSRRGAEFFETITHTAAREGTRLRFYGVRCDLLFLVELVTGSNDFELVAELPTDSFELELGDKQATDHVEIPSLWGEGMPQSEDAPLRLESVRNPMGGVAVGLRYRGDHITGPDGYVYSSDDPPGGYGLFFHLDISRRAPVARRLLRERIGDLLPTRVSRMSVPVRSGWAGLDRRFITARVVRRETVACQISIEAYLGDWKNLWSAEEYRREFARVCERACAPRLQIYLPEDAPDEIWLEERELDPTLRLEEFLARWEPAITDVHRATEQILSESVRSDSLVTHFRFAPEVRVACEQYLLYFVQFLRDLGVDADAELRHQAQDVLFSVTPRGGAEALLKIGEALRLYLDIPARHDLDSSMLAVQEPWMQSLGANVYHLKGQLIAQASILQAKDATLASQERTISTLQTLAAERETRLSELRSLVSGEVMQQALLEMHTGTAPRDEEPLLGSAVTVVPVEWKGVRVHLPDILRRFKQWFADEDLPPPGTWF
jgi:hypothetical protein